MAGQRGSATSPGFSSLTPSFSPAFFYIGLVLHKETPSRLTPCSFKSKIKETVSVAPRRTLATGICVHFELWPRGWKPLLDNQGQGPPPKWGGWISITWTLNDCVGKRLCPTQNQEWLTEAQRLGGQKQPMLISNKDKESSRGSGIVGEMNWTLSLLFPKLWKTYMIKFILPVVHQK